MSKLNDIFQKALSPFKKTSDVNKAMDRMDEGKIVTFKPKSDRYTYGNQADTEYDKKWKPETKEEKETLSPKGYYRVGEREQIRKDLQGGIDDKTFNDNYHEKQISVDSTAIKDIQYDPDTEGLTVTFQGSNKKYFYPAVPMELVQALMKAPSKGEFFMANIHDQYSMYGKDHSPKNKKQQKGIKAYMKSYMQNNKGKWSK